MPASINHCCCPRTTAHVRRFFEQVSASITHKKGKRALYYEMDLHCEWLGKSAGKLDIWCQACHFLTCATDNSTVDVLLWGELGGTTQFYHGDDPTLFRSKERAERSDPSAMAGRGTLRWRCLFLGDLPPPQNALWFPFFETFQEGVPSLKERQTQVYNIAHDTKFELGGDEPLA